MALGLNLIKEKEVGMTTKEARKNPEAILFRKYSKEEGTGVDKFYIARDGMIITFKSDKHYYTYNFEKPGEEHIKKMKGLAKNGKGLTSYINRYVRGNYFEKWLPKEELQPS